MMTNFPSDEAALAFAAFCACQRGAETLADPERAKFFEDADMVRASLDLAEIEKGFGVPRDRLRRGLVELHGMTILVVHQDLTEPDWFLVREGYPGAIAMQYAPADWFKAIRLLLAGGAGAEHG